jgi:hypothetical protein
MNEPNIKNEVEVRSLIADLNWLENEYPGIKCRAIEAEYRRKRVEQRLRDNGLIELVE